VGSEYAERSAVRSGCAAFVDISIFQVMEGTSGHRQPSEVDKKTLEYIVPPYGFHFIAY
jgi:hypothetical protein